MVLKDIEDENDLKKCVVCGSLNVDDVSTCGVCGRDFRRVQPVARKGPRIKTIAKKMLVLIVGIEIIVFGWLLPTRSVPFGLANAEIPLFVLLASFVALLGGISLAIASLGSFRNKLPGLVWGSAQAFIVAGSAVTGILFSPPYTIPMTPDGTVIATVKLFVQGSIVSVGMLVGYVLEEAEPTAKALLLSQVVGEPPSFFILLYGSQLRGGGNGYQSVFLIGLTILFSIYATLAGFSGAFLASWMSSIGRYRMNLKLVSIGLSLSVSANFLPYSTWFPAPSSFSQTQDWFVSFVGGSDWPVSVAVMLSLILTGSVVAFLGLSRRSTASSKQAGLVLVASLLAIGVTSVTLSYVLTVNDWCVVQGCGQSEDFLRILWILPLSMLAPTFVIIRSVASTFRAKGYR